MEASILAFWAVVIAALIALRRWPDSAVAHAAFTWFGPVPERGEAWAKFQFRWAAYSFSWLCQFCLLLTALWLLSRYSPGIDSAVWFRVLFFALPLGVGMALLALLGFLIKAAKARFFGPNPVWHGPEEETRAA